MKRTLAIVAVVVFVLAIASVIWAGQSYSGSAKKPVAKLMGAKVGLPEHDRCTKTCDAMMNFYHANFTKMKVHQGDKQCWQNCWSRFGTGSKPTVQQTKALWTNKQKQNMRANQCAQACWRMHHDNSKTVAVAGWRSNPRPIICSK